MSGLAWKLRRLRAMSPAEILARSRRGFADRVAPPAWSRWSAAEAARLLFDRAPLEAPACERWARVAHPPASAESAGSLAAAERLATGRWSRFGVEVPLGDPPRWNVDPATGAEWPDRASREIDWHRTDLAGGAKGVWEAGRLTMLPTLALTARLGRDPGDAARARRWLADFVAKNPLGRGIHHASGIEMAIRNLTMSWTLALLDREPGARGAETTDGEPSLEARVAGLVVQQALWCRDHLSLGSSANNHLLAEYAAMVVAGAGWPGARDADRLLVEGLAGFERELPRQIHADGVTAEQAFRYLPFVWELVLPSLALAEAAGRRTPEPVSARLAHSLEFARTLRRADGTLPPIGDEDDARILLAEEDGSRLDLAGNALAAWLGEPGLADGVTALATLLFGRRPTASRAAPEGTRTFAEGGCTVWRSGAAFATFDHGPLGLGSLAAHGHADALSLTLRHGDDDLIVDPGTLAYHEDEAARSASRATSSHSTVSFGGRSQSEMLGPFLWGRRARVAMDGDGWRCEWWSGERHSRRVSFAAGEIAIEDRVLGPAATEVFALAPGAEVRLDGRRAEVAVGRSVLRLDAEGAEAWRVEPGQVATRFAKREAAPRLVASLAEREVRIQIRFGPR